MNNRSMLELLAILAGANPSKVRDSDAPDVQIELLQMRVAYDRLLAEHQRLVEQWNELVQIINSKGGRAFLEGNGAQNHPKMTKEVVKKLIILCHPDKHDGKPIAQEVTQILLEIRKTL